VLVFFLEKNHQKTQGNKEGISSFFLLMLNDVLFIVFAVKDTMICKIIVLYPVLSEYMPTYPFSCLDSTLLLAGFYV